MPTQPDLARTQLADWLDAQPRDLYAADSFFQRALRVFAGQEALEDIEPDLAAFGPLAATEVDPLVRENNLDANLPRLERYDGIGRRIERIAHHPSYHEAGALIYGSGVMEAYGREHPNLRALSLMYLSSQNGEAGHNCPLACTAGVIRVLQELGTEEMKARWLPGLLSRDYDTHLEGAQFLTELQGGSDVGANAVQAELADDGTWRIHGEKWFCSNIDADLFLMTARVGDAEGTRGLGLFLVPRLWDGEPNGLRIRRLKHKLGTRSMASGETDFVGARGWHMGPLGEGFAQVMRLVIHTSRMYNAAACMGLARRAFTVAHSYAHHRRAFGQRIVHFPLVQAHLQAMERSLEQGLAGTLHHVVVQDLLDRGAGDERLQAYQRLGVNLNKMTTAMDARQLVIDAIEVLGGNGAIESFSVLPRLLRDVIVYENWEGTHNTLVMQSWRDMQKYGLHEPYLDQLLVMGAPQDEVDAMSRRVAEVLAMEPGPASVALKPLLAELSRMQQHTAWRRVHEA